MNFSQSSVSSIRNVAIIAHVDHGKTTLVDGMLRQTNVFHANQHVTDRVLDSNDLERERGITILAKNTGVRYDSTTINIVDTPGHADFGGEVERVMNMVDGALLLVDAVEGPMPQTRFVLRKALERGLKIVVVVNKVDRPSSRPDFVVNATFDLFVDLGADDEQADFPVVYTNALQGLSGFSPDELSPNLDPLFTTIVDHLPAPDADINGPTQMLVAMIEYSSYVGKIAVGRLSGGTIRSGQQIAHITAAGDITVAKVVQAYSFRNLKRHEEDEMQAGTIVAVAGIPDVGIGDTLTSPDDPRQLPPITVEEPTVRMTFAVNDSPFAGREGKYLTSRQLRARLQQELERNVALRLDETDVTSQFVVSGRGELHLAILIETMRREGYELSVSRPEVIFKDGDEGNLEPVERVYLEALEDYLGVVSEMMGTRRGQLQDIRYGEDGTVYCEYLVPTRGMLGFRQPFMTATRGTGVYHTLFHGYVPYLGAIDSRQAGTLIALEPGTVSTYALTNLSQRGAFIVQPGEEVYAGQVVGEHIREEELVVNVCKAKQLTNFRDKPKPDVDGPGTSIRLSLDDAIQFLGNSDLLEVTPLALRIRKKELRHEIRQREVKRAKQERIPG